jgi:hypothetical protein
MTRNVSTELDALEAEFALALANRSLPRDKREEIEQRLGAIRQKAGRSAVNETVSPADAPRAQDTRPCVPTLITALTVTV